MSQNEKRLPVTSPDDLCKTGHLLLTRQTDIISKILLTLWKHRRTIEIGVFDFTPEQHFATTSDGLNDDAMTCIEYQVISVEEAKGALSQLQLAFDYRKNTPSAPGTWVLLIDGFAPEYFDLFKDYLKDGKQARIYVIAAMRQGASSGPMHDMFDTVIGEPESRAE
jgi:hypothetical protein